MFSHLLICFLIGREALRNGSRTHTEGLQFEQHLEDLLCEHKQHPECKCAAAPRHAIARRGAALRRATALPVDRQSKCGPKDGVASSPYSINFRNAGDSFQRTAQEI